MSTTRTPATTKKTDKTGKSESTTATRGVVINTSAPISTTVPIPTTSPPVSPKTLQAIKDAEASSSSSSTRSGKDVIEQIVHVGGMDIPGTEDIRSLLREIRELKSVHIINAELTNTVKELSDRQELMRVALEKALEVRQELPIKPSPMLPTPEELGSNKPPATPELERKSTLEQIKSYISTNKVRITSASKNAMYDVEEEKVRRRELLEEANQKLVFDEEKNDVYEAYVRWLIKREEMLPFDTYHSFYKNRYTLLSANGRHMEFVRTLFKTRANKHLFSSWWQQWYKRRMHKAGLENHAKVRPVDTRILLLPGWFIDNRDTSLITRTAADNDLPSYSYTLEELPMELRADPPNYKPQRIPELSLDEWAAKYVFQRKLHKAAHTKSESTPTI